MKALELYKDGLTARQIDGELGLSNSTASRIIKSHGAKKLNSKAKYIDPEHIECSKCFEVKHIMEFSIIRRHGPVLSYCNVCRNKKKSVTLEKYLEHKYYDRKRKNKNKVPFDISLEDFIEQFHNQRGLCFYTDTPLITENGNGNDRNCCSVDKIIPHIGYVKGNVVFCTHRINTIKNDLSMEEIAKYVPSFYGKIQTLQNGMFSHTNNNSISSINVPNGQAKTFPNIINRNVLASNYCKTNNCFGMLIIGMHRFYKEDYSRIFSNRLTEEEKIFLHTGSRNGFYIFDNLDLIRKMNIEFLINRTAYFELSAYYYDCNGVEISEILKQDFYDTPFQEINKK